MSCPDEEDRYRIDPTKLPKPIELDLMPELKEKLHALSERSGRSIDELILEILDRALRDQQD